MVRPVFPSDLDLLELFGVEPMVEDEAFGATWVMTRGQERLECFLDRYAGVVSARLTLAGRDLFHFRTDGVESVSVWRRHQIRALDIRFSDTSKIRPILIGIEPHFSLFWQGQAW